MFLDSRIALISNEEIESVTQLKELGLKDNLSLNSEDFQYRPIRIRIDDIKYVYQALDKELIVLELYDTEGQFMLKDNINRINKLIDEHYSPKS
jgi:hypothetical protein